MKLAGDVRFDANYVRSSTDDDDRIRYGNGMAEDQAIANESATKHVRSEIETTADNSTKRVVVDDNGIERTVLAPRGLLTIVALMLTGRVDIFTTKRNDRIDGDPDVIKAFLCLCRHDAIKTKVVFSVCIDRNTDEELLAVARVEGVRREAHGKAWDAHHSKIKRLEDDFKKASPQLFELYEEVNTFYWWRKQGEWGDDDDDDDDDNDNLPKMGQCAHCQKSKERSNLMTCGRCKVVQYCSRGCQVANWPEHIDGCGLYVVARNRQEACAKGKSE